MFVFSLLNEASKSFKTYIYIILEVFSFAVLLVSLKLSSTLRDISAWPCVLADGLT